MFEFDQYEAPLWDGAGPAASEDHQPADAPAARAFLWWSEHCIECAEPGCYATCALYRARPDGRCRRFVWGIRPTPHPAAPGGVAADVAFKTWGKLETHGNATLEPADVVLRRERLLAAGAAEWPAASEPADAGPADVTHDPDGRLLPPVPRRIVKRLHARWLRGEQPAPFRVDHLLVDVENPGAAAVALQVSMRIDDDRRDPPPPFLATLDLPPGRSRHAIPYGDFARIVEARRPFKIAVMPAGDAGARLTFLALDLVGVPARPGVKCVVFDLDGTLWPGVLVEGGDTRPRPGMVRLIRALDDRGILVSVASKNDPDRAMARLRGAGLERYVLAPQIGWGPKSAGIRAIAEALNIGRDTLAFVDDSPYERAEVAAALPDVQCVAPEEAPALLADPRFAGLGSTDARQRRRYYQTEETRRRASASWGDDHLGFLKSCELVLTVEDYRASDFERVVELVQRTNQLNFSGAKYTPDHLAAVLADPAVRVRVLRCRDRFGDYGTVGVVLVTRAGSVLRIEDMMISCRVQGRLIERAVFAHLVAAETEDRPERLWVRFRATGRNTPAAELLDALGFEQGDCARELSLAGRELATDVVRIEPARSADVRTASNASADAR